MVETMTEYEMEREARLAKNREVLRRLGVPEMAAGMATADDDDDDDERERRKKMRKAARARDSGGGEPARRSSRASTVATRTGRFYEGKGDGGDDDDDSFSEEDEDDADGSDDEDEDDLDDERRPTAKPEAKKKKKKKIPAEPRPERRATPASLYRLPNRSMLGRLAPYAVEGAGFERRPSAFMRPRLSSIPSSGATGDGGIEPTVARPVIDAVASTDHPPSTAERPKAARKAPRVQKRQRAKKPAPAKPPPTPEGFADDVAAAFAAIQPAANRVAMNRGFATIDQVTIGHRELVDACRRHGFYEWSEGDVAKMMAVAGEAVGRDGASCGETRLSLEDFKRVATHVGARRADV